MCAKSITGRTHGEARGDLAHVVQRAELTHASHHLDSEGHRAVLPLEPLAQLPELLDDGVDRVLPRAAEQEAGVEDDELGAAPARAMPAEWSSIPIAMLSFFPRSACPMNPAIGACTERAMSFARQSSPSSAAKS